MAVQAKWEISIDPQQFAAMLRDPGSPPYRQMNRAAQIVKQGAQRRVGVWRPLAGDPFAERRIAHRRPGTLRDSAYTRVVDRGRVPVWQVTFDDEVAFWHHEGTHAHTIRARRAPNLVFWNGHSVVVTPMVRHPGTEPNHYLTDALDDLRGRNLG